MIVRPKVFEREMPPPGNHAARCYMIAAIGTQNTGFKHKKTGEDVLEDRVIFGWELPEERLKDGRPMVITREYNISTGEKADLRKMAESWRGVPLTREEIQALDLSPFLNKPCLVNIIHKPSQDGSHVYARVLSVSAPPKGMNIPACENPLVMFDINAPDTKAYKELPEWIQKKIDAAVESNPPEDGDARSPEERAQDEKEGVPF